jgi:hypothetical protein
MAAQRTWSFPDWLSSLLLVPAFFLLLYAALVNGIGFFDEAMFQQLSKSGEHWQPTPAYYLFHAIIFGFAVILAVIVGRWADSSRKRAS